MLLVIRPTLPGDLNLGWRFLVPDDESSLMLPTAKTCRKNTRIPLFFWNRIDRSWKPCYDGSFVAFLEHFEDVRLARLRSFRGTGHWLHCQRYWSHQQFPRSIRLKFFLTITFDTKKGPWVMSFDSVSPETEDKPKGCSRMIRDKHKIRFSCEDAFGI